MRSRAIRDGPAGTAGILRAVPLASLIIRARSRSRTAAAPRTSRRTPGARSSTRSGWATPTWRPTRRRPPTGCWWRSTTRPWTGSPTGAGRIAELPYREVAAARIGGTEPIPLLEDLLGAWPDVRFNIDVKDAPAVAAAGRACSRATARLGPGLHHLVLRPAAAAPPGGCCARPVCMATSPAGVGAVRPGCPARALAARLAPGCRSAAPRSRSGWRPRRFVRRAHAAGLQVHVWTVNDRGDHGRAARPRRRRHHDRPDRGAARGADQPAASGIRGPAAVRGLPATRQISGLHGVGILGWPGILSGNSPLS